MSGPKNKDAKLKFLKNSLDRTDSTATKANAEYANSKLSASAQSTINQYFKIKVRDENKFTRLRRRYIGKPGHILRIAGRTENGFWDTQSWLISKDDAHISDGELVPDTEDAKRIIDTLSTKPSLVEDNIFEVRQPHTTQPHTTS